MKGIRRFLERVAAWARRHRGGLLGILAGTFVFAFIVTDSTFEFFEHDLRFSTYYDALGDSMLHGRFDVPLREIDQEAFFINGRTYGYYGPTPALFRIVLDHVRPSLRGLWTRPLMVAYGFLTLASLYTLLECARRASQRRDLALPQTESQSWVTAAFILGTVAGTPLLFVAHSPILYHEAITCAVAFAMCAFACVASYQQRGRLITAVTGSFCAFLSWQARGSVGAGAACSVVLLGIVMAWSLLRPYLPRRVFRGDASNPVALPPVPRRRLAIHFVVLTLCSAAWFGAGAYKNVKVLGSVAGTPPMDHHQQLMNDPERLSRTDGGHFFQPNNLRTLVVNYLDPHAIELRAPFPYLFPEEENEVQQYPETRLDHIESWASLTSTNTFWCLAAIVGIIMMLLPALVSRPRLARMRLVALGALAGSLPIFMSMVISERFLADMVPFLAIAGAVGVWSIAAAWHESRWARPAAAALGLLAAVTCFTNVSITAAIARW